MIAEKNMIAEFVELGINGHNEDDILDYMLEVLGHGFVYYNYVNNVKKSKLRRKERRIAKKNAYEYEIRFKNDLVGKFVFNLPEKALSEEEKEAVKSAGNVILLMNKEKISVEIEEKDLKQEFVLDICTGNLKTREEFNIRNRLNGWDIKEHAAVVIFDLDEFKKKTVDLDGNGKEVEIVKEKMFRGLKKAFLDADLIFYNYQNSDSIIFLFEANAAYKKNREAVFSKVMKTSETEYGFTYTVGLGRTVDNILYIAHNLIACNFS